jgi:hypothetical protein
MNKNHEREKHSINEVVTFTKTNIPSTFKLKTSSIIFKLNTLPAFSPKKQENQRVTTLNNSKTINDYNHTVTKNTEKPNENTVFIYQIIILIIIFSFLLSIPFPILCFS